MACFDDFSKRRKLVSKRRKSLNIMFKVHLSSISTHPALKRTQTQTYIKT